MTETRIRRGGASRLSVRSSRPARKTSRRPRGPVEALLLARLPIRPETVQKLMTWGILAILGLLAWLVASLFGLPAMAREELASLAARAGYQVEKVEVHGVQRMDERPVYAIALGEVDRSMLTVDLAGVRARILHLSWVKDARVSRRLPDTLVVDIVERQPAAVWQQGGHLALIDATGAVLQAVSPAQMPDLPLLVGDDANRQAPRLARLMEAAPALKPILAGATWVGNRRWDLRFQSGETLSLPEGDEQAAAALVTFARLDGLNRLLGRGIPRFDMRDPDKFVLRMPKDAGAAKGDGEGAGSAVGNASAVSGVDGIKDMLVKDGLGGGGGDAGKKAGKDAGKTAPDKNGARGSSGAGRQG